MEGKVELSIERYEALRSIERGYEEKLSAIRVEKTAEVMRVQKRLDEERFNMSYEIEKRVDDAIDSIRTASFIKRLKYLFTKEL